MIAGDHEHPDVGFVQPTHLLREEEPGVVVLPVAVIEISGEENERDLFVEGQVHQLGERFSRCSSDGLDGGGLESREPSQRAVEVYVGRM